MSNRVTFSFPPAGIVAFTLKFTWMTQVSCSSIKFIDRSAALKDSTAAPLIFLKTLQCLLQYNVEVFYNLRLIIRYRMQKENSYENRMEFESTVPTPIKQVLSAVKYVCRSVVYSLLFVFVKLSFQVAFMSTNVVANISK